jgi:hypothetical protein
LYGAESRVHMMYLRSKLASRSYHSTLHTNVIPSYFIFVPDSRGNEGSCVLHRSRREQRNCAANRSEVNDSFFFSELIITTPWSESFTWNDSFRNDPSLHTDATKKSLMVIFIWKESCTVALCFDSLPFHLSNYAFIVITYSEKTLRYISQVVSMK